jgi:hypothetical protein
MTRFKKALLARVTVLTLGSALAVSATPATARDACPVIAGALGGFTVGAILGSTVGHSGYYGGGDNSSGYYPAGNFYILRRITPRSIPAAAMRSAVRSTIPGATSSAIGAFVSATEDNFQEIATPAPSPVIVAKRLAQEDSSGAIVGRTDILFVSCPVRTSDPLLPV